MNNKSTKPRGTRTTKPPKEQKVSRTHAPEEISPVEWQRILRNCACPDYATNELGTCKHIEFVLARLEKKRGAKAAFARGYHPPFS